MRKPGDNDFREVYGHRYLVPAETQVLVRRPGGGGWGEALDREAEAVRWDVIEDLVSREQAKAKYGVVLKDDLTLDIAATEKERQTIRTNGSTDKDPVAIPKAVIDAAGISVMKTDLTVFATGLSK
jgi:hypothetical protein